MSNDFTFLKGNIETIILCSLESGDKYGWEIAKEIKDRTDGKYEIKQPTLYAYLKRLESSDQIKSYWGAESNGGRRKYYALTQNGRDQCSRFAAEWKYHQTVLNNLIDEKIIENADAVSQDDVTPIFGSKTKRKQRALSTDEDLSEIERRLNDLSLPTQTQEADTTATVAPPTAPAPREQEKTAPAPQPTRERHEEPQQDVDSFMLSFEQKIKELEEKGEQVNNPIADDYQHVIMNVLGSQLDDAEQNLFSEEAQPKQSPVKNEKTGALEDVAENFASQGIRMRIYNKATSKYTSQTLVCLNKVSCITSWLVYLFYVVGLSVMWAVTREAVNFSTFATVGGILLVIPLFFSIVFALKPIRAHKPEINFKSLTLIVSLVSLAVAIIWIGSVILFNLVDFANALQLVSGVLIPVWLILGVPLALVIFNALLNYYVK